jgi:hypothetical protein
VYRVRPAHRFTQMRAKVLSARAGVVPVSRSPAQFRILVSGWSF